MTSALKPRKVFFRMFCPRRGYLSPRTWVTRAERIRGEWKVAAKLKGCSQAWCIGTGWIEPTEPYIEVQVEGTMRGNYSWPDYQRRAICGTCAGLINHVPPMPVIGGK